MATVNVATVGASHTTKQPPPDKPVTMFRRIQQVFTDAVGIVRHERHLAHVQSQLRHETKQRERKAQAELAAARKQAKIMKKKFVVHECVSCFSDFAIEHGLAKYTMTPWCKHDAKVCAVCAANWISSSAETGGFDRVHCIQCKCILVDEDIERLADNETLRRSVS